MKRLKFLAIFLFIFIMFTTVSLARPGGGGSSGGSSGSGGSSSSRSRGGSSNYTQQSNPNSAGVATLAMSTTIIIMSKTNYIISWFKVTKKKKQCRRVLMDLSKYNSNWELDKINKDIKDTFYIMSKALTNMDQDIAIEYSTKKLYENHKTKLEWMKIRNERNILKMEKLK